MRKRLFAAPLLAAPLLLAGCSDATEAPDEMTDPALTEETVVDPATSDYDADAPGAGSEYSYLTLLPLRDGDEDVLSAQSAPLGSCRFLDEDGRRLLVVARSDNVSSPGIGVARPNGKGALRFDALEPGTDYVDAGPELAIHEPGNTLPQISIVIDRAEGEGEKVGVETLQWPATIAASDPDAQGKPLPGTWSCGV